MTVLFAIYTLASLAHFVHNAEFIAFYPGMPAAITRESVYVAWLGVAAIGGLSLLAGRAGWPRLAAGLLCAYGLLGLDGLLHYTLALCSEHTFVTNLTIWAEALLGLTLACASALHLHRLSRPCEAARRAGA